MKKFILFLFFIVGLLILIVTNTSWLSFGQNNEKIEVTDAINKIEIHASSGNTQVIPENRDTVDVEYNGKGKVELKKTGDTIKIEYKSKNWFHFLSFNEKKLKIYIPEHYQNQLIMNSNSGNIEFAGNSKINFDRVSIEIGSGNLSLEQMTTNEFVSNSKSGNFKIDTLTTKSGSIDVKSGNVEVNNYSGQLKSDITSGRLQLQLAELISDIDIKVHSGDATVDLPENADYHLKGKIGSGVITTNGLNMSNLKENEHSIEGTSGTGKHSISLDVSSGRIGLN
ncbi:DUF4097 family beta strand repeat-containing protein [Metabacillus malikii]|uniref:Lia operon protein LiaG n=1 Tax=Metabacillus malikii TaxID=1504265 RepID=A0ABT9ZAU0_9BACI|nr:DUF4097 family beta strand repeat-containing protein [Metabacillus malikii]MDQ0229337.1 lia operon protein LiaG [Metabacillus malikii]